MSDKTAINAKARGIAAAIRMSVLDTMAHASEKIVGEMKDTLQRKGHIDTGALYESIRAEVNTESGGDVVVSRIYADAQSPEGTMYAEFIELGSGAAHGRPGGRQGTWRYRDREGNWHTTDGMDADPFIMPAVEKYAPGQQDFSVSLEESIAKYGAAKAAQMLAQIEGGGAG